MPEAIMKAFRSTCCLLLAVILFATGCWTRRPDPNPLVGWKYTFSQDPDKLDKAIRDDYQDYIQHLPPEERKFGESISLYEDESGRHAVTIEINLHGTRWEHVLIYDQNNRRVQAVKRYGGHYQS